MDAFYGLRGKRCLVIRTRTLAHTVLQLQRKTCRHRLPLTTTANVSSCLQRNSATLKSHVHVLQCAFTAQFWTNFNSDGLSESSNTATPKQAVQEGALTENSMFFLSWLTALGSGTGSVCLMTDTDSPGEEQEHCGGVYGSLLGHTQELSFGPVTFSPPNILAHVHTAGNFHHVHQRCVSVWRVVPVRMDWSTRNVVDLIEVTRMSAGTLSPTERGKEKRESGITSPPNALQLGTSRLSTLTTKPEHLPSTQTASLRVAQPQGSFFGVLAHPYR